MPDGAGVADPWGELRAWVACHCGIVLEHGRSEQFHERMTALCSRLRLTPAEVLTHLHRGDRSLSLEVADAATTNYTQFFREREAFDFLAEQVYPSFEAGPVRMWSAATSTGEEAYSLAIHATLQLGSEALARVKVLGTDLSDRHVATAERGMYAESRVEHLLPGERLGLEPVGMGQCRVRATIRSMCTFRRLNLLQPGWPFTQPFHVILCRNVLYYFEYAARVALFEAMFDATAPGGWLITSFTDPTGDICSRWSRVAPGLFRRR